LSTLVRARRPTERERWRDVARGAEPAEQSADHPVLTLQRSAGNRAVANGLMIAREGAPAGGAPAKEAVKTIGTITLEGPEIGTISFPIEKFITIGGGYAIRAPHTRDEAEIRRAMKEENLDAGEPPPGVSKVTIVTGDQTVDLLQCHVRNYDGADPEIFRFELRPAPSR
jgi:hypothetical protein